MEASHSTSPGALHPEDSWTCPRCGWVYPNPHPSAKHRRNHKKHCGKIKGFELISEKHDGGSSDEASSGEEAHIYKEHSLHKTHHVLPAKAVVDIPRSSVPDVSPTMIEDGSSAAAGGVSTATEVVNHENVASTGTSLNEVVPGAVKVVASPTQDGLPAGINTFAVAESPPVLPAEAEAPMISTEIFPPVVDVSPPVGGELPLAAEQASKVADQVRDFELPPLGSSSSLSVRDVEVCAAVPDSTVPILDALSEVSKGTEGNVKKTVAMEENKITSGSDQTRDLFSLTNETSALHADLKVTAGESIPVLPTSTLNVTPEVSEVKKDEANQGVSREGGETRSATLQNDTDQAENLHKQEIAPVKTEKPMEQAGHKSSETGLPKANTASTSWPTVVDSSSHDENITVSAQGPEQPGEPEYDRNSGNGTSDNLTEHEKVSVTSIPVSSPPAIIEGETRVLLDGIVVDTPIRSIPENPEALAEGTPHKEENLETALELPAVRLEKEDTMTGSRDLYTENSLVQNEIAMNTVFTVPNVVSPTKDNEGGEGLVESHSRDSSEQPPLLQEVETHAVTLTGSYPDKEGFQDLANVKVGSEQESASDIGAAQNESNLQHDDLPESSFKETLLPGEILASGSVVEAERFGAGKVITEQDSAPENKPLPTWSKVDGDDLANSLKPPLLSEEVVATGLVPIEGHTDKDVCLANASEHDSVSKVGSYNNTDQIEQNFKDPQHEVGNSLEKAENVPQAAIAMTETKLKVDECNEPCNAANTADTFEIQKTLIDSANAESTDFGFPGTMAKAKAAEPGLEEDSVTQTERWVPPPVRSDSLGTENYEDARDSLEACSVGGSVGEDEAAELEASLEKSQSDKKMGFNGSLNLESNSGVSGPPLQDISTLPGKSTSAGAAQDLKAPSPEAWQEPAGAAQDLKAPSPEAWQEPGVSEVVSEDNDPQTEEVLSETKLQGIESEVKEDRDSKRHTPLRSLLAKEGSDKTGQKNTASSVEKVGEANDKWGSSSETKPKTRSIWSHCICCPAVH